MRNRVTRLGLLFASILGLVGVMAPPAHATKTTTFTFTGNASLSTGFGSPCTPPQPTDPGCVPATSTHTKDGKKGPIVEQRVHNGNTASFGFAFKSCVASSTNAGKTKPTAKLPADEGTCSITATGVVTGFCGLSSGTGTATATVVVPLLYTQIYTVPTFKFWSTPAGLKVTSNQDNTFKTNQFGTVVETGGQFNAFATAEATRGSCTNKTATGFTITGDANITFKNPPLR